MRTRDRSATAVASRRAASSAAEVQPPDDVEVADFPILRKAARQSRLVTGHAVRGQRPDVKAVAENESPRGMTPVTA